MLLICVIQIIWLFHLSKMLLPDENIVKFLCTRSKSRHNFTICDYVTLLHHSPYFVLYCCTISEPHPFIYRKLDKYKL